MVVMQVLVKSYKIKACKEGVADLSRGGLSDPMRERPNTRKKGDADLSTVLIGSKIYTCSCPLLFNVLFYVSLRVTVGVRLVRTRSSHAARVESFIL